MYRVIDAAAFLEDGTIKVIIISECEYCPESGHCYICDGTKVGKVTYGFPIAVFKRLILGLRGT